jgi:riboflavin biosynthesis pyrimidine reductase
MERLLIEGDGVANGTFLHAGVIDEPSLFALSSTDRQAR